MPDESKFAAAPTPQDVSVEQRGSDAERILQIAAHGDLVLRVEHETKATGDVCFFRASSPTLKMNSKFFERLLQPGRFGEGVHIEEEHSRLRQKYGNISEIPSEKLPRVDLKDLGRISRISSVQNLFADFLYILHGKDTTTFPPIANLANLAIVADRFDALEVVGRYVKRKKMIRAIDGKTTPKQDMNLSEEKVRQRLLVALMLDYPAWVAKYSARVITQGWVGKETDVGAALWWDLPHRVEDELAYRRECLLDTVQSLQSHFLGLYTTRERQCKLGYDSSAQCDSFQLGEMIRFFTRMGTLEFQGKLLDTNEPPSAYSGNVYHIIETLRQIPEYQIDLNHKHCGIRTRLVPLLDVIEELLPSTGICANCWSQSRANYAWMDVKRPLLWAKPRSRGKNQSPCDNEHAQVRELFTAEQRNWSGVSEGQSVLIADHATPMQMLR